MVSLRWAEARREACGVTVAGDRLHHPEAQLAHAGVTVVADLVPNVVRGVTIPVQLWATLLKPNPRTRP